MTHTAAKAIFQLKKNKAITIIVIEIIEPISSGIQCELAVSINAQPDIMVFVKSDKSFLLKKTMVVSLTFQQDFFFEHHFQHRLKKGGFILNIRRKYNEYDRNKNFNNEKAFIFWQLTF